MGDGIGYCKECGGENVQGVTRVVGYFARIGDMNNSKISEIKDRHNGDYSVNKTHAIPMKMDYGKDGIYLIGKEHCSMCASEEDVLRMALSEAGLEGLVDTTVMKITDIDGKYNSGHLAFAAKVDAPLSMLPALVAIKNGKVRYMAVGDNQPTIAEMSERFSEIYGSLKGHEYAKSA